MSTTSTRPLPEIIRDLAVLADRDALGWITLANLAAAVTRRVPDRSDALQHCAAAIEAVTILRRLDDGTLDVATLIDEPCTNLDAAREAYIAQYEGQLTAACRALASRCRMSDKDLSVTVKISCYVSTLSDLENLCLIARSKGATDEADVEQASGDNRRTVAINHVVKVTS